MRYVAVCLNTSPACCVSGPVCSGTRPDWSVCVRRRRHHTSAWGTARPCLCTAVGGHSLPGHPQCPGHETCRYEDQVSLRIKEKRFYFYTSTPVHSDTNSTSLGTIQPHWILREDYPFTFTPLSIARYTFMQLIELGHRGDRKCPSFETTANSIECNSLLLSYWSSPAQ